MLTDRKNIYAITFFSPSMKRTGSEIVLFNLLEKLSSRFKAKLVTKYKGELSALLPATIPADHLYKHPSNTLFRRIVNRLTRQFIVPAKLAAHKKEVWYVNTISLPDIIEYAANHHIKTILHLHELEQRFALLSPADLQRTLQYPGLIIANSNTSKKVLNAYGRTENIEICYPVLDTKKVVKDKNAYDLFRQKLNIAESAFLWVMCGTLDENKNPFLFIETAAEISKTHPGARFMWIGSAPEIAYYETCKQKAKELQVSDKIIWQLNDPANYYNYFNCADGFVLTSKKESFSLVTVEALLLELPIVAQNCGGVTEILGNDLGTIVEEMNNPVKMAEAMIAYMSGTATMDTGKGKQRAFEFDSTVGAKRWNDILINYLES